MVPIFVTGEPKRNWNFIFSILANPTTLMDKNSSWKTVLFNNIVTTYVSLLCEKFNPPSSQLDYDLVPVSIIKYPVPKGYLMSDLSASFIEDEINLVSWFHQSWQAHISGESKLNFNEILGMSAVISYAPTVRLATPFNETLDDRKIPIDVPTGLDIWPNCFPAKVELDPEDKGGSDLSRVSVVYARVPILTNSVI